MGCFVGGYGFLGAASGFYSLLFGVFWRFCPELEVLMLVGVLFSGLGGRKRRWCSWVIVFRSPLIAVFSVALGGSIAGFWVCFTSIFSLVFLV